MAASYRILKVTQEEEECDTCDTYTIIQNPLANGHPDFRKSYGWWLPTNTNGLLSLFPEYIISRPNVNSIEPYRPPE